MSRSSIGGRRGAPSAHAEIAAEFVRLKVDVIVTHPTALALAAKQATSLIPIVFALAGDPVGSGLVTSLARPGGNVTGLSLQMPDALTQATRTVARDCPRAAPFSNPRQCRQSYRSAGDAQRSSSGRAPSASRLSYSEIRRAEDIEAAFEAFNGRSEALYVCTEPLVNIHRARINALALNATPTLSGRFP